METHEAESIVRGYHIYKDIWSAAVGSNPHDSYAVAMIKDDVAAKKYFSGMFRGGVMTCTITGVRQYSSDLPQGGLTFSGSTKEVETIQKLLSLALLDTSATNIKAATISNPEPATSSLYNRDTLGLTNVIIKMS